MYRSFNFPTIANTNGCCLYHGLQKTLHKTTKPIHPPQMVTHLTTPSTTTFLPQFSGFLQISITQSSIKQRSPLFHLLCSIFSLGTRHPSDTLSPPSRLPLMWPATEQTNSHIPWAIGHGRNEKLQILHLLQCHEASGLWQGSCGMSWNQRKGQTLSAFQSTPSDIALETRMHSWNRTSEGLN